MKETTILIVDDEPANLSTISSILSPIYSLRVAKSGRACLDLIQSTPLPDLILLDVVMPDMTGYEVIQHLKAQKELKNVPVIFFTALDEDLDEERGLSLGAVDYITKPVKPSLLLVRIQAHLEVKQARDILENQNQWLEQEVNRRTRENLIIQDISLGVILEIAESRDADTGNHIARTQSYVELLAKEASNNPAYSSELTSENINAMVKAAPLHDIGKVGIPDHILLKPGKLNPAEWEIMQTHSAIGAQVIERAIAKAIASSSQDQESLSKLESLQILACAKDIAAYHHEKWNGTGYPFHLSGEQIPLAARIMAIADVYDALTTERVYKKAWPHEEAVSHIVAQKNTQFDPSLIVAFETIQDSFLQIQEALKDTIAIGPL